MILNTFYVLSLNRGSDLNDVREILMDVHLSQSITILKNVKFFIYLPLYDDVLFTDISFETNAKC